VFFLLFKLSKSILLLQTNKQTNEQTNEQTRKRNKQCDLFVSFVFPHSTEKRIAELRRMLGDKREERRNNDAAISSILMHTYR
jgi:hypothetical protein